MPSPIMKATLASAALSSCSNVLAQILEAYRDGRPFALDIAMFLRFVTVAFLTSPPNYMWQQLLEKTFPAYEPANKHGDNNNEKKTKSDDPRDLEKQIPIEAGGAENKKPKLNVKNTLTKWFIDCITLGAIFNTVAFFILMGLLKGQSGSVIMYNVRYETIPVIIAGYKIWPFASIISFSCVPVERRIVFLNFVGLLWGIYMSLVASRV
ncbi:hypothetical protein GGS20DRAFT_28577 [Poronia punctata]|nr:hypothetical protein GGS20DRAFT_28577 [Poronia punctata]